jgi:UDP-GlcNAc:undecaprenyl-phosphate GlcNAc-1-phosphate transferase
VIAVAWPLGASFALAVVLVPVLARVARQRGWVDAPGPLKIHPRPVPYTGGLAVALACILALALTAPILGIVPHVAPVMVPAVLMAIVGFVDDLRTLSPWVRLVAGTAVGLALLVELNVPGAWGTPFGPWVTPLAAIYLVGIVNVVNMQDGLDGLAGSLVFLSSAGCAVAAAIVGEPTVLRLALVLCGAVAGFLVFNRPPASVFMGDSGSYFLGFAVGAMTLLLAMKGGTALHVAGGLLLVGLPVVDGTLAIVRRALRGQSPFRGDRAHLHDQLAQKGLSAGRVDLVCSLVQAVLVGAGLLLFAV